jgi:hypothetical protein
VSAESRHEQDGVSLMGGLLLMLIAALFLIGDLTTFDLDARWTGPVALIAVGVAGLLSTLRSSTRASGSRES